MEPDGTIRVDFHAHSNLSDGVLPPDELAEQVAASGIAAAALTDHDTLDGLDAFRRTLQRKGIGFIPGVEVTVQMRGREAHLLAYGFDPSHVELRSALASVRQWRTTDVHSIASTMRMRGIREAASGNGEHPASAPGGQLDVANGIDLIHRAGGRAFLAHPFQLEADPERLRELVIQLRALGLDGLEAIYTPYTTEQQAQLAAMAGDLGLLTSGGSDLHDLRTGDRPGIEMPLDSWKRFRDAVCSELRLPSAERSAEGKLPGHLASRFRMRNFLLHILCPSLLAIILFVGALFGLLLPALGQSLLDRKREMIRELVASAWSILAEAEALEKNGEMSREQAQELARLRIQAMRYGREANDYFWLQDMYPHIIMHPYRPDLNGKDVSDYRDTRGVHIFKEFSQLVRQQQSYNEVRRK